MQLARVVGVRQGTVSDWELANSEPRFSDVVALERALGVSFRPEQPSDLFERGYAAGEFRALASMATAIADRAEGAAQRLTPVVDAGTRARVAVEAVEKSARARGRRRKA